MNRSVSALRRLSAAAFLPLLAACGEDVSGGEAVAGIGLVGLLIGLVALALVVYAVLDLLRQPYPMSKKLIWGLVIFFIPFIGAIAYLLLGKGGNEIIHK